MDRNPKQLLIATCLGAVVACAGLTGCSTANHASANHTGGPHYSDASTARRIRSELAGSSVFKLRGVRTEVNNGVAQLSGYVSAEEQRKYACNVAARTPGVRRVVNNIRLESEGPLTPVGYSSGQPQLQAPAPIVTQPPAYETTASGAQASPNSTRVGGLGSANRQSPSTDN